ncbi:DNA/RNA polymerases superfamily protein [Cucumis melo var. makuwa]|uniref:DNA/RNA polymerases superfamily protein n=1 Tax=Cucumis melo var. makuwa TaxID=1194695 RepID=A0A5A7T0V0_CUCMM|nr:DNA/RNA polymerases superfamily protein [Cucumis melo var. makuwa]TYK13467.1 DNA/RNA polymerases superfamily protein [Cucumis melo var. makuwa]
MARNSGGLSMQQRQVEKASLRGKNSRRLSRISSTLVPRSFCDANRNEFMNLVKGDITVEEYEKRFIELAKYASTFVIDEEDKCKQFKDGLQTEIRAWITNNMNWAFCQILSKCGDLSEPKKCAQSVNQPYQPDKAEVGPSGVKRPVRSKLQGYVCAMTRSEATRDNPHVITEPLEIELLISTPSGEVFLIEQVCRDLEVSIECDRMEVDLCLFELEELDVILGMEFLPKYHAILDCFNKEVVLRNPGKFEVNFEGDKEVKFERIISVLHARKRVKKGHTTYLEHLVDTRVPKDNPSRMPIVCEYLDVFLKELS